MEDILKYENRKQLFDFLISQFGFVIEEEKYDESNFGNFYIVLASQDFLLCYVNDRSILNIEIASKIEPSKWYSLSFINDLIYNPHDINNHERLDNESEIKRLNNFLAKDYSKISELFNSENYSKTKQQLDTLLKEQFNKKFPN